jgi:hypothetical protein
MTIFFVTTGAWGAGTGSPLAAAQVDGNFYDVDQRIVGLTTDLAEGKRIDFVTYTDTDFTFHYTDATTQTIPLAVATFQYVGPWMPSTPYIRSDLFSEGNGFYQVLEDHTSAGTFDPNATDGTTDNNPLYALWMPLYDTLDSLTDVEVSTGIQDGDILVWNGAGWTNQPPSSAASLAINDLTDVIISSPVTNNILLFNGTNWVNSASVSSPLDGLSDVTITGPVTGQPLVYDGAAWVNKSVADLPVLNSGSKSGSFVIDMQTNEFIRIQMTGNCTVSSFIWPSGSSGRFVRRIVEMKNNGSFTLTWPTGLKWPSGGVPTQSTGATDVYAIFTYDGGATVFASAVGQGYS